MKKCPFCAEEIQEEAIKCRFCNEFLDGKTGSLSQTKKYSWLFKTSTLIVGFFAVGPLIIPLIWLHPQYSKAKKIVLISLCIVVTVLIVESLKTSLASIGEYYQLIQGNY